MTDRLINEYGSSRLARTKFSGVEWNQIIVYANSQSPKPSEAVLNDIRIAKSKLPVWDFASLPDSEVRERIRTWNIMPPLWLFGNVNLDSLNTVLVSFAKSREISRK